MEEVFSFGNLVIENFPYKLVNKKIKVYEIFYQDLFCFGPLKKHGKSLTIKAQINIDNLTFESNVEYKNIRI